MVGKCSNYGAACVQRGKLNQQTWDAKMPFRSGLGPLRFQALRNQCREMVGDNPGRHLSPGWFTVLSTELFFFFFFSLMKWNLTPYCLLHPNTSQSNCQQAVLLDNVLGLIFHIRTRGMLKSKRYVTEIVPISPIPCRCRDNDSD